MGRTGNDWLKAATGREATAGEIAEYYVKNGALLPARFLIEQFIQNNGGGIANFLYNAWLRTEVYYLPNQKKYDAEYLVLSKPIEEKYTYKVWSTPADALKRYQDAYSAFSSSNPNGTFNKKVVDFYTPSQLEAYNLSKLGNEPLIALKKKAYDELYAKLEKKYPKSSRLIEAADGKSQTAYRNLELFWYWKLGGSPDDLNNAVKEGNTKSPRGKDANYLINKLYGNGVKAGDIGLIIRAFVSAFAGDKFGLGEQGTFVIGISGNKKQGIGEPLTAAVISAKITLYLPTVLVALGALGAVMKEMKTSGIIKDPENPNKSEYDFAVEEGWKEIAPTGVESDSKTVAKTDGTTATVYREKIKEDGVTDDNTTTYIVAGVAALGLLYFISKK
jgi:hypothetical protein